jgi:NAD(P)-dependent dehydrogenase (short-subunit alcohol dehydrogenase family)
VSGPLDGKVALVAGATRGAGRGTAVALGEAGATVYCTGRSTRERRSEYERPETIEETAELVGEVGGIGIAFAFDHLELAQVAALERRIDADQGRLDVLVNDGRASSATRSTDPNLQPRNGGSFSSGELAREYGFTDTDGSQPDAWRYLVEVQETGLPAAPTGYR